MMLKRAPLTLLPLAALLALGCSAGTSTNGDKKGKFINGPIKVTTGEAILAHINADAWKTMPAELKVACGCGEVRTPKK